jgi:gamma-glutamylcyclotransferase (GGCT)/AIG2-like uncharacterized protein YtfP
MNRVFVYGTLKRGQRNCHFLHSAEFLGNFTTHRIYSMYEFEDYPAVCLHGRHAIEGEVYHVTDRQFRMLDDLEWYPHFVHRQGKALPRQKTTPRHLALNQPYC